MIFFFADYCRNVAEKNNKNSKSNKLKAVSFIPIPKKKKKLTNLIRL